MLCFCQLLSLEKRRPLKLYPTAYRVRLIIINMTDMSYFLRNLGPGCQLSTTMASGGSCTPNAAEEGRDDDPLEKAWAALLPRWEDGGAHTRFLNLAAGLDRLADAGAFYRQAKEDPARQAVAEAQIAQLLGRAVAQMQTSLGPPIDPRQRYRTLRFVAWVLSLILIILVLLAYRAGN